MDSPKIGNGLPVIGQGTDRGVPSLHRVGNLGKNYDSAKDASDGYCPACREKGKLKALKTYRISFQESIFLCEDLQCIYPLGSKSLNNLICPDLEDCHIPNKPQKRKILATSYEDSPPLTNSKKTRNHFVIDGEQTLNSKPNGDPYDETSGLPELPQSGRQNVVRTADSLEQKIVEPDSVDCPAGEDPPTVDIAGTRETSPQNQGCTSELELPLETSSTSLCQTSCVQWKNTFALCWLDCILSALVHLEGLRNAVTELCTTQESVFRQLFTKYNEADKLLHTHQLDAVKDEDCKKLPSVLFTKIDACLNEVRDEIFTRLQPQLRCTLGDMESPVFAFPLLLKIEPHIEKLFMYSFSWNFECSQCGHKYQNRCIKTLVTFTHVIPEWHPLNAAHFGPCNSCNNKSQIRKMVLEKVSPIFMVHFVEGLPHNDLQQYLFHFEDSIYQVTSVIQYQANNHFITWILDADGSWLECDDLKGPCAERHEKFEVPASEIHIVIWEGKISQMIDTTVAGLPLTKKTDQHAFSDENPAFPASCSVGDAASAETSSVTHPSDTSGVPTALSQAEAVVIGDQSLSSPCGLVDNNLLTLTLEEIQVNSDGFLLEKRPVGENEGIFETNTLQLQESLTNSFVLAPCTEKLIKDQAVDVRFPSQVINADVPSVQPNTEDIVITQPVNNGHATDLTQGVESIEIERSPQFRQFLSPETEKLKSEHVTSQVSNLKKKEAATHSPGIAARSVQNQPPKALKENQKKPFVGSWVKGLLSKGASFMPPCVSAHTRNTITDLQPSVKGASNFGGFKTKGINQKANQVSRKARKCASKPPPVSNPPPNGTAAHLRPSGSADSDVLKQSESAPHGAHLSHSSHGNESGISSASHGNSVDGQIHRLRLKLLKKLKAKKKKLAALMSSPQNGTLPGENLENASHCGSPNDCESIEDLLNELQYQIDNADTKSGCTTIAGASQCSGQTQEEILAELLSPTAVVSAEPAEHGEADFRYLEMGDNRIPAPVADALNTTPQDTHLRQDHNYCSPTKKHQGEVQTDSLTSHSCVRTLNLETCMKTDIFDEFFSTSALNSLADDPLDLPHFDEYLFESC
uniref:Ubiquitin specific peptidase like 1 n=1 Tax=Loxodonta africana TaxID=9785 RepID=G3T0D7_LOXAF